MAGLREAALADHEPLDQVYRLEDIQFLEEQGEAVFQRLGYRRKVLFRDAPHFPLEVAEGPLSSLVEELLLRLSFQKNF